MKLTYIYTLVMMGIISSCALNEPEVKIDDEDFPFILVIDEEGADLANAEDYGVEIGFADYLGDLPTNPITLTYELSGEGDFEEVVIDEIVYEYEDGDCVFVREIEFTANTITIPVDEDMGTVLEAFEIVLLMNEAEINATDGNYTLTITGLNSTDNVLFSAANAFEYEILDNDMAGEWVLEITSEPQFTAFKEVFGIISPDLAALAFSDISGEVKFEFEFEEMKIEVELNEEEEVTECIDGTTESEMENLVIEIEAGYDAEEGELEMEGSYFNEDGEELDFIIEAEYVPGISDDTEITFTLVIDEDNYEEDEELFSGSNTFSLIKD